MTKKTEEQIKQMNLIADEVFARALKELSHSIMVLMQQKEKFPDIDPLALMDCYSLGYLDAAIYIADKAGITEEQFQTAIGIAWKNLRERAEMDKQYKQELAEKATDPTELN